MPPPSIPFDYMQRLDRRNRQEAARNKPDETDAATIRAIRGENAREVMRAAGNPDAVARTTRVARQSGAPTYEVEGNEDRYERSMMEAIGAQMAERYASFATFVARNPRGAAASVDDSDSISKMYDAWGGMDNFNFSRPRHGIGFINDIQDTTGKLPATVNAGFRGVGTQGAKMNYGIADTFGWINDAWQSFAAPNTVTVGELQERAAERDAYWRGGVEEAEKAQIAARPEYTGYVQQNVLQAVEQIPTTLGAILAGAASRNPNVAASLMGTQTAAVSYGDARLEGAPRGTSFKYAVEQGVIEGLTEKIPVSSLLSDIAKKTPFGKTLARQLAEEVPNEQVATALQDMSEWVNLNPDGTLEEYLADRPEAALSTLIQTASGTTAQTAVAVATERTAGAAVKLVESVGEARQARREAEFFEKAGKALEGSKLKQRDPDALRELLRLQAEEAGATNVYIPGEAIRELYQSDNYDPDRDPFADVDWQEADASGGDVLMPVADYLADVVGTPTHEALKGSVRLSAGGMSLTEAEQFEVALDDAMEAISREFAERDRVDAKERSTREKLVDEVATMFGESFPAPTARQIAELAVARAQTRAERLGQTLTGSEFQDVSVRQVLPEGVAEAVKADTLDLVINALRVGKSAEIGQGPTLLQFIKARGGVNDTGGDLASMGVPKSLLRDFNPDQGAFGGVSGAGDYGLDSTLRAAIEDGFFPDLANLENEAGTSQLDTNVLLEAIRQELAGSPVYAETREDNIRAAADDLRQVLSEAGYDFDKMSDEEIRSVIERMEGEMADGRAYEQYDLEAVVARWQKSLADVRSGALQGGATLQLGRVSAPYRALGFKGVIRIHAGKLRKILPKHASLPREVMERLPAYLADPLLVVPGQANDGRTLVVLNAPDKTGSPIFGAVEKDPDGGNNTLFTLFAADNDGYGRTIRAVDGALKRGENVYSREGFAGSASMAEAVEAFSLTGPVAVMDPRKAAKLIVDKEAVGKRFSSFNQSAQGRIIFDRNQRIIELFQGRNISTPIHELGHMWLEELAADASMEGASEQVVSDYKTVCKWFSDNGVKLGKGSIPTEAHELWARGVERYVMEGKAPSSALKRIFEQFRMMLVRIYKTVANLNSPITPEIREVMDRMLATDAELAQAREEQSLQALFNEAADAGMSEQEFTAYREQLEETRAEAYSSLIEKTTRSIRYREQRKYAKARKEIRAEEGQRIDNELVFKALRLMRESRISKEWIEEEMGVDALGLLPARVPPLWEAGGTDPNVIAEIVGYGSAREMIEALIGAERAHRQAKEGGDKRSMRVRAIDTATDREFSRRYGDPFTDGSIEREALEAVHSDRQGELIAAELRALSRKTGQRPTPYRIARDWARGKIRSGIVADEAMPAAIQRYSRNAAKAGKLATEAMVAQNADEAFRQKQFQMLNNALLKEAKEALDEVQAAVRRMDKVAKSKTRKSTDQDYLEQAQALLETVDLRRRSQIGIERQGSWEAWAEARQTEGFDVLTPKSFEATIGKTNWSKLSVETLLTLDEQVKQILHLGRLKQTMLDNQERREFAAIIAEVEANGDKIGRKPPKGSFVDPTWWENTKARMHAFDAGFLRMEQVVDWLDDGDSNGVFNRMVFRPIADAQAQQRTMLESYHKRLKEAARKLDDKTVRSWADKVTLDVIDPETGLPAVFQRKKIVSMALNWGNLGNRQRLADGYGWSERGVEAALMENLSEAEWQYVQDVWDIIGDLWPSIEQMERAINGIAPDKVDAAEIVTPFGTLKGGYYPAIYDSTLDYAAEEREAEKSDLFSANYIRATTRASATKARSEKVARPILLDLGVINRHLGEIIHDVTHRAPVMQAHKFLNDRRVKRMIDETLNPEIRKQFQPWLNYVANSWAMERSGNEGIGRFMGKLRANVTVVGMGWRFTTMLTQIAGYSNSFEFVGAKWVAPQIAKFQAQIAGSVGKLATFQGVQMPEMMAFALERSKELPFRLDTLDRDIRQEMDRLQQRGTKGGAVEGLTAAKKFAFHGIGYMDRLVSVPTWVGAYNKAIDQGKGEQAAIYYADKAIRLSQGAGSPKDLAAVSRGTGRWGEAFKLLTMFYTYLSAVYSRQRNLGRDIRRGDKGLPELVARAWWLVVVPPLLAELLSGRGPDEDEEWGWWAFQNMLNQSLGAIPIARDLTGPVFDEIVGRRGFDYRLSPLQGAGQSAVNVADDIGKTLQGKDTKRATRNALEFAGYMTGMVPGQFAASAQFLVDVSEGDAKPEGFDEWYEGMTKGRVKE